MLHLKKIGKSFLTLMAFTMLLGGFVISSSANEPGKQSRYVQTVQVNGLRVYYGGNDTAAAGLIHSGTLVDVLSTHAFNKRKCGLIYSMRSGSDNGWGGHTMWMAGEYLK